MRSLDLLFDLDGIIADLHAPWLEWINRHAGTALTKMDIHTYQMEQVAPKGVNVYDFLNTPGCYSTLPPVDGALEVLQQLHDDGHHVLIATMPVRRPESTTEKLEWCARMLPWLSRRAIYVGGDKSRILADGFTDDDPTNLRDFRKRQPQAFLATIAWPYNEGVDVEVRAQDCTRPHDAWQELYQRFTLFARLATRSGALTVQAGVTERLYRITAPHFCAGFVVHGHYVRDTAPILHWLKGWPLTAVLVYCRRKRWQLERISDTPVQ